jgi:glycosyltransferase involved in cell wall biosynthesis
VSALRLKIAHAVSSIEDAASGTSVAIHNLAASQAEIGNIVALHTVGVSPRVRSLDHVPSVLTEDTYSQIVHDQTIAWNRLTKKLHFARDFTWSLIEGDYHVIHSHGLWRMPTIYSARAASLARVPLILSTHGMLASSALEYSSMQKRIFNFLLHRKWLQSAQMIHVTSAREYDDIRSFGLRQPVAIVPLGVHIRPQLTGLKLPQKRRSVLSLCRLHPIKGLEDLLQAWLLIEPDFPDCDLIIAGPDEEGYRSHLENVAANLGLRNVRFVGEQVGIEKERLFASSSLFVMASRTENFGLTVLESLSFGVPVIATKGTPWRKLRERGCGWWIDHGVGPLESAIRVALGLPARKLQEMGALGITLVSEEYSWRQVASDMTDAYLWTLRWGDRPSFVIEG